MLSGCSSASEEPNATEATKASTTSPIGQEEQAKVVVSHLENLQAGSSLVATATGAEVAVHNKPGGPAGRSLASPIESGGPLTFLVVGEQDDWLKVHLPIRPNGATGWIARDQVELSTTSYRLVVSMQKHRLDVLKNGERIDRYQVGVGKSTTPTPPGEYYLTELIQPNDPQGSYGPYAFGLSAHSQTLTKFAGGPGQLGLHGTNQPDRIGTDVSHGCLRLANEVITELAQTLPLGTPIEIQA